MRLGQRFEYQVGFVGDLGFVERQRETLVSINEVQKMLKSLIVSWSKNSPA